MNDKKTVVGQESVKKDFEQILSTQSDEWIKKNKGRLFVLIRKHDGREENRRRYSHQKDILYYLAMLHIMTPKTLANIYDTLPKKGNLSPKTDRGLELIIACNQIEEAKNIINQDHDPKNLERIIKIALRAALRYDRLTILKVVLEKIDKPELIRERLFTAVRYGRDNLLKSMLERLKAIEPPEPPSEKIYEKNYRLLESIIKLQSQTQSPAMSESIFKSINLLIACNATLLKKEDVTNVVFNAIERRKSIDFAEHFPENHFNVNDRHEFDEGAGKEPWLWPAIYNNNLEAVKWLVDNGIDLKPDPKTGRTILHDMLENAWANEELRLPIIKCLVERGKIDVSARDAEDKTALDRLKRMSFKSYKIKEEIQKYLNSAMEKAQEAEIAPETPPKPTR